MSNRSFLPLFFIGLALVLVAAIGLRIRSYNRESAESTDGASASESAAPQNETQGHASGIVSPSSEGTQPAGVGIVTPVPNATAAPVTVSSASREQRFAEALAAAQREGGVQQQKTAAPRAASAPAPAVSKPMGAPKSEPGLLSRIGTAISNAFGGSSSARPAQPQASSPSPQNNSQKSGGDTPDRPKVKDPTSDTSPPQLLGVIFQPPVINDGQETAAIITATDDLSGIRNIAGSIASPSGKALQGFAAQRESPESNRYVARIAVPKGCEQGLWRINFISITDNAGNTTNVNSSWNGGVGFTVNSESGDSTPPVLRSAYLERRSINGGEKDTLFVQASDDKSGVAMVSGVFQSPNKSARIGFGCRATDPENFVCDVVAMKTADCGDWQLEQIQMQDKAQNQSTFRYTDNAVVAPVKMNIIADKCDSTPPNIESLSLDPLMTTANGVVNVTAMVTDDISGAASVSGTAAGPPGDDGQPPKVYFPMRQSPDNPQIWTGEIKVPQDAAKGLWSIVWMSALDKSNNTRYFTPADAVLKNAPKFTVR